MNIEVNSATLDDLLRINGVGEVRAQAILDHRAVCGGMLDNVTWRGCNLPDDMLTNLVVEEHVIFDEGAAVADQEAPRSGVDQVFNDFHLLVQKLQSDMSQEITRNLETTTTQLNVVRGECRGISNQVDTCRQQCVGINDQIRGVTDQFRVVNQVLGGQTDRLDVVRDGVTVMDTNVDSVKNQCDAVLKGVSDNGIILEETQGGVRLANQAISQCLERVSLNRSGIQNIIGLLQNKPHVELMKC